MESKKGSVREETNAVSGTTTIVQNRHQKPLHPLSHQQQEGRASRKRSLRGKSPSGKTDRQPCKNFLKGSCTQLPCDYWHPPECQFYKSESGGKFGNECSFPHRKVEEQPNKRPKKGGDKSAAAIAKDVRQLCCVLQDVEPPESSAISRKGTKVLWPGRRVRLTRAALRQASIRESKGPSLNQIQVKLPPPRSPYAVKFEDRPQEDTERQERCARGDVWRLANNINKLKEKEKLLSFRLSVSGFCRPHPQ